MAYDFKNKNLENKYDGKRVILTGNFYIMENCHGIVLETVGDYSDDFKTQHDEVDNILFKHMIILSINELERDFNVIEKATDEEIISHPTSFIDGEFSSNIEKFKTKYEHFLSKNSIKRLNISGGLTFADGEGGGSFFSLNKPIILRKTKEEVVKRILITHDMLEDFIKDDLLTLELFAEIDKEFKELGSPDYSLLDPQGDINFKRRHDFSSTVELRIIGKR